MARIVFATIGSLGDLHPKISLGMELRRRGHDVIVCTLRGYEEKVVSLGMEFAPIRPEVDEHDSELARRLMDAKLGPETVIRELIFPHLREMYDDLLVASEGADMIMSGEIVYAVSSLAEKTGIKWISTTLAPLSMFSSYDPNVYPQAQWLEFLRPLPATFHKNLFEVMRWTIRDWYEPVINFRRELGLSENIDPIFRDKFSKLLNLALFSRALARPAPDWFSPTLQTGFCFFDESGITEPDLRLAQFLNSGEPPIVFTLGSAAVMDARDFFEQSASAARRMNRRALLIYGRDQPVPGGLTGDVLALEFAPYSLVFPRAACVVHQGGVGTTGQALRAGVPQVIVPFSHDQPDNAARCRRAGVAEIISRDSYTAERAATAIERVLSDQNYRLRAAGLKQIVDSEDGTVTACDAIEEILEKPAGSR